MARPLPRQQLSAAEEVERLDEAELRQRARNAADLATRHLDGMASRLERQIEALEQSRNGLLDELARELQDMEPGAAARELALLDDESAALALRRLPPAFRTQVLGALEPTRRRALRSQLNSLKDN